MEKNFEIKNILKYIFPALSSLFLGWVGTFIYNIVGFESKITNLQSFFTITLETARDNAIREATAYQTFPVVGMLVITLFIFNTLNVIKNIIENSNRLKGVSYWAVTIFFFIIFVWTLQTSVPAFYALKYTDSVGTMTRTNIEIVRPYLTSEEYDSLLLDYYQIDGLADFEIIKDKLSKIGEEHQLSLK